MYVASEKSHEEEVSSDWSIGYIFQKIKYKEVKTANQQIQGSKDDQSAKYKTVQHVFRNI